MAACGTPRYAVEYDYDGDASFEGLRRYAWLEGRGSETGRSDVDRILREALERNLERLGMVRVERDPDCWVACTLETRRRVGSRTVDTRSMMDTRYGYGNYYFNGTGGVETDVIDYVEGTLIVDVAIDGGRRPIWRGWAHGAIRDNMTDAEVRAEATEAFRQVLEKFPPPAKRSKQNKQ